MPRQGRGETAVGPCAFRRSSSLLALQESVEKAQTNAAFDFKAKFFAKLRLPCTSALNYATTVDGGTWPLEFSSRQGGTRVYTVFRNFSGF